MTRYAIIAAVLVASAVTTHFLGDRAVKSTRDHLSGFQSAQLEKAIDWIESDFDAAQEDLLVRARAVAADDDALFLIEAQFAGKEPTRAVEDAITRFQNEHETDGLVSVELYGTGMSLRAWSGPSILPRPDSGTVLADELVRLVEDPFRKALTLWMPVGKRGAVRVARAVEATTVETSFLGSEDLVDTWRQATGLQLDVNFGSEELIVDENRFALLPLLNEAANRLATVVISRSSGEGLIRSVEARYADVEAFWWALLLIWTGGVVWFSTWLRSRSRLSSLTVLYGVVAAQLGILIAMRYGLLWLDVPGRWFHDGPARALFDPTHLASDVSGGIARSIGDLALTSLFLFGAALTTFLTVARYRPAQRKSSLGTTVVGGFFSVGLITSLTLGQSELTRQSMLDATLDFFAWTGLSPEPLVLVVFCALLLSTIATILFGAGILVGYARWARLDTNHQARPVATTSLAGASMVMAAGLYTLDLNDLIPWWTFLLFMTTMSWPAYRYLKYRSPFVRALRIRSILMTVLVSAVLLYPLLYGGMAEQRRLRVLDVADDFASRGDAEARYAVEAVLEQIREAPETIQILSRAQPLFPDAELLESLAYQYPIVDLIPGIQAAHVAFYGADLAVLASYQQDRRHAFAPTSSVPEPPSGLLQADLPDFLYQIRTIEDPSSGEVEGYIGIATIWLPESARPSWLIVTVERREVQSPFGSLFGYSDWRRSLALAEFRGGQRVRSEGEDFERLVLPPEIEIETQTTPEVWVNEEVYGRAYVTYYRRVTPAGRPTAYDAERAQVVAVRARAIIPYDHLYYLLRVALAGLWIGIPAFILGLVVRMRMGLIPARRRQYGDRVLDAFLIVGTLAVAGMGLIGQQVITRENEGAIRSRLERRLQRMEDALARSARPGETLDQVQERTPVDSLAELLSLDLAIYHGPWLVETSTMLSDAGPLMGYRLPAEAYDELFILRFRQAFVESSNQFGEVHTIGYKALLDEDGWPRSVVAVLTFPEQARIREERARTTAYFFGALLLLLLVIMGTATTLARALTSPLRRLRDGMQSVAAGRVQRPIPVESRDEVGQLVETFNLMQNQLSESRRKLAQQERELAWSEMARQVAHEIKNPLTPMKLSIQHLQRAYDEFNPSDVESRGRFKAAFSRITNMVSEQIDTLAEIANEFSTFARLPRRHVETVDPNQIIREAVALTQTELKSGIQFNETREPVFVNADPDELRRVFINLIKNAVHAVDAEGTVEVVARITAGLGESPSVRAVLCEVIDNGDGIAPDVQARIFHPNFSTKTSGMGLGLAIAKRSVEAMNGEIGFTTEVGKGSTFWIKLPLVDT